MDVNSRGTVRVEPGLKRVRAYLAGRLVAGAQLAQVGLPTDTSLQVAVAMATDLAEFVGAALGLRLVFGLPLWVSGILTGVAAFAILSMEVWGFRRLEATITAFVAVVVLAFCLEVRKSGPPAGAVARGFVPGLPGGSTLLAVGIVGATVMPHVIYLHSALTKKRIVGTSADARRRIFRFEMVDISIAMGLASDTSAMPSGGGSSGSRSSTCCSPWAWPGWSTWRCWRRRGRSSGPAG